MAKLTGKIGADDNASVTRKGQRVMDVWVQTEYGRIEVSMNANGRYTVAHVELGPDYKPSGKITRLAAGNVNESGAYQWAGKLTEMEG